MLLRVLGLLLLVLGRPLPRAPFLLGLQVAFIDHFYLGEPSGDDRVDTALARGKISRDITDEVELRGRAVDIDAHARGEHADGRRNGEDSGHGEVRAHGVDALPHALRHFGQRVVVVEVVLEQRFLLLGLLPGLGPHVLAHGRQHVLQPFRHLRLLLAQGRPDASHFLRLGKSVVAGDDAVQQLRVGVADVAEVDGQLESERVAVGPYRVLSFIVEGPPFLDDAVVGNALVAHGLLL